MGRSLHVAFQVYLFGMAGLEFHDAKDAAKYVMDLRVSKDLLPEGEPDWCT